MYNGLYLPVEVLVVNAQGVLLLLKLLVVSKKGACDTQHVGRHTPLPLIVAMAIDTPWPLIALDKQVRMGNSGRW